MRARRHIRSAVAALAGACAAAVVAAAPAAAATPTAQQAPVGRSLTASHASHGLLMPSTAYQWKRCSAASCTDVPGATGPTLALTPRDIGAGFRVVTTTTGALPPQVEMSDQVTVQPRPPVKVVSPTVTGSASSGSQLSGSPGYYTDPTGGQVPTIASAWYRCPAASTPAPAGCTLLAGDSASVALGPADAGSYVHYVVVASAFGQTVVDTVRGPVAGPPPPPAKPPVARPSRLRPFPVIVVAGRLSGTITRITNFTVKGPRGARVAVTCSGRRGCPFRRARTRTIPRGGRLRIPALQRLYGVGAVLEIRVTKGQRIGKYTKLRFRALAAPARLDRCLMPRARRPSPCS